MFTGAGQPTYQSSNPSIQSIHQKQQQISPVKNKLINKCGLPPMFIFFVLPPYLLSANLQEKLDRDAQLEYEQPGCKWVPMKLPLFRNVSQGLGVDC